MTPVSGKTSPAVVLIRGDRESLVVAHVQASYQAPDGSLVLVLAKPA